MSSARIIIVARNNETGEIQLPLGDLTLYGTGSEEQTLQFARRDYGEEWTLSLYRPYGDQWCGNKT